MYKNRKCLNILMMSHRLFVNTFFTRSFAYSAKNDFQRTPGTGKVTVIRKRFTRDSVEILQWKRAASVVKKFNWENANLFGDMIKHTKNNAQGSFKHPIIRYTPSVSGTEEKSSSSIMEGAQSDLDTPFKSKSLDKQEGLSAQPLRTCSEDILDAILDFPMLNEPDKKLTNCVNELRQNLQERSRVIPSVTKILDKTMPPESVAALERWRMQMIEEMGKENFEAYHKEMLSSGSMLHCNIKEFLSGVPEEELTIHESNAGHWKSVQKVLPHIQKVTLLEQHVTHPFLCYRGIVDCFAKYGDELVVIDWKTSKKPKLSLRSTYDNPLQLAAYVGALNFDPVFEYMADKGLLVIVYEQGQPANVYFLRKTLLKDYWMEWLKRLKKYWESLE